MNIAGHYFPNDEWVKKCSRCGMRLTYIMSTQESDIGKGGIACYGALSVAEYQSIRDHREAIWAITAGRAKNPDDEAQAAE